MNQAKLATYSARQLDMLTDALIDDPVRRIQEQGAKNRATAEDKVLEALAGGSGQAAVKAARGGGNRGLTKVETMQVAAIIQELQHGSAAEPEAERGATEASAHAVGADASKPLGEPAASSAAEVALAPPILALLPMR